METLIHLDGVTLDGPSNQLLKMKTKQIARHAERCGRGHMSLDVRLSDVGSGQIAVDCDIKFDGSHIHVRKTSPDAKQAIKQATSAIARQFDKVRIQRNSRMRSRVTYRRKRFFNEQLSWQQFLDHASTEPSVNELIEAELPRLKFIATTELAFHIGNGDVEPGAIDPIEVIDEVIVRDFSELADKSPQEIRALLIRDLLQLIADRVTDWKREAETNVSTDFDVSNIGDQLSLSYLGDEVLDFWIPDDELVLGDVTSDPSSKNPEEVIANKELRHQLFAALAKIPKEHRVTFAGAVMDEEKVEDLAIYLNCGREEVEHLLAAAKQMLADRLSTVEQPLDANQVTGMYNSLGKTFQVDLDNIVQMH